MAFFEAKIDATRLEAAMRRAPHLLVEEMTVAMRQHGEVFRREMLSRRFDGGAGRLHTRTGTLAGSIGYRVVGGNGSSLGSLRLVVFIGGPARHYAGIQERGGTITGKPWLTVPLRDNLTATGVPRFKSAAALRADPNMRTFIVRTSSGALLIGWRRAPKDVQWLWVLKKAVKLKPRLGFEKTFFGRKMASDRVRRMNAAVRRALERVEGLSA